MSVSQCPFRSRRRFALIIAMMAWVTSTEKPVLGELGTDPKTIATPGESNEPTNLTLLFPPIERMPIRLAVPKVSLPPGIAAGRSEIERKSLERIFAGGMIVSESNHDVQPIERQPATIVALAPQETVLAQSPWDDKMIDAGVLDQPSALSNPPLVSDRIQELPKPVHLPMIKAPYLIESDRPIETRLPNYALPGGGLDVFQLAPSRFGRPLPNAR